MKSKVAVVTGAGGFIGSNLTRKLIKENINVHVFVKSKSSLKRLDDLLGSINIHITNMGDEKKLKKLLANISPNYIFHLATFENYRDQTKVAEMITTNIVATKNLLLASLNIPYECFVNTGSSSEYGLKRKPMKEIDLLEPLSFYAATKASATLLSQIVALQCKKPIITFRLFSVYGPYETPTRFIPTAIESFIKNKPLPLTAGQIRRDFVFIDDVVNAYMKTTTVKVKPGEIYNIGTGKQYSNDDVVKTLEKITKKKIKIEKNKFPKRIWDTDFWVADVSKTNSQLNWKARTSLKEGLTKTYNWFAKN